MNSPYRPTHAGNTRHRWPGGAGKTTLLAALLPQLKQSGLRVAVIKRTHPEFGIDQPGKDSQVFRAAGAAQVLLASPARWALIAEREPPLDY